MNLKRTFDGLLPRTLIRVLPAATITLVLVAMVTSHVVEKSFRQHVQAGLEKDARFGAEIVSSKLNGIISSIRSVAANDLVLNGLVDTEAREAYVPLYFSQLQIAGLRSGAKISFTDYRGRLIAANWQSQGYVNAKWLYRVIDNGREYIRFDKNGAVLVVPVIYQGNSEGAIAIEIGKQQLAQIISISFGASAVLISSKGEELFSSGPEISGIFQAGEKPAEGWIQFTAPVVGFPNIQVTVAEHTDIAFAVVHEAEKLLLLTLVIILVALAAGIVSTAYLTTNPLTAFATELKRFGVASDLDRRIVPAGGSELRDLADSFNSMLERMQKTVVSNEQLEGEIELRKNAEEALQEQNERFIVALENMSLGVCVFDRHGRLVVSNGRYATMYDLTAEIVKPGMTAREIAEQRVRRGIFAGKPDDYVQDRVDWGRCDNVSKITELSDGRTILISRRALSDGGWVSTHEDITERRRMERLKNEFVSVVSHELRTPLTSLVGSLRLISSGTLGSFPDKAKSLLDIAYRNTERLTLLVNDILDVEKITSDSMVFDVTPTDVVELARKAISENEAFGAEYDVRFRLQEDVGTGFAAIDENRIMQVLANLLSNAVKFSDRGSEVVVRISREGRVLRCAVIDTGAGIPEDKQSQLFDRFFQVDASDSRSKQGTGLGLTIVKAIVEKHGSQIHVESEVGKGSTFYFDLEEVDAPVGINSAPAKIERAGVA